MLATNHVLSGALIGALVRRPMLAFGAGVASHFVLDSVPHWGKWESRSRFLRVAVPDGLVSLAAMTAFSALAPADRRAATAAGNSMSPRRAGRRTDSSPGPVRWPSRRFPEPSRCSCRPQETNPQDQGLRVLGVWAGDEGHHRGPSGLRLAIVTGGSVGASAPLFGLG